MQATNKDILASGPALSTLMECDLPARVSLLLDRIAPVFDEEVERIQKYRQKIAHKMDALEEDESVSNEEKQEQFLELQAEHKELMEDEVALPGPDNKIPFEKIESASLSAYKLNALSWLVDIESVEL